MQRFLSTMHSSIELILSKRQYIILCALLLAAVPFTTQLAVAFVAFITLRKGPSEGAVALIAAITVQFGMLHTSMASITFCLVNALALYVPCYVAAYVLRSTMSWQSVAGVLFVLVSFGVILVQMIAPELVLEQYLYLETIIKETQSDVLIAKIFNDLSGTNKTIIASYAFGMQVLSMLVSSITSLMVARALQSRLYNAGGFKKEVLGFRVNTVGILILIVLIFAVYLQNLIAITLMPMFFLYFLLAGLSVSASTLNKKNAKFTLIPLVPLIVAPVATVPFYCILGLFYSLFNLSVFTLKPKKRG
jgi:hypothetical protein